MNQKTIFAIVASLTLILALGAYAADQAEQTGYVQITDATLTADMPLTCGECIVRFDFQFQDETDFSASANWIPGTSKFHLSGLGQYLWLSEGANKIEHRAISNKGRKGPISVWNLLMVPPAPPFIPPPFSIESFNGVLPIDDDSVLE